MKRIPIIAVIFCGLAAGQSKPAVVPPVAPVAVDEPNSYPFPLEERNKIRDLQHENDQLEIENQKMLVKLEQNRARQSALIDQMKLSAFQFAQAKHINLDRYELDPAPIWFIRKKTK